MVEFVYDYDYNSGEYVFSYTITSYLARGPCRASNPGSTAQATCPKELDQYYNTRINTVLQPRLVTGSIDLRASGNKAVNGIQYSRLAAETLSYIQPIDCSIMDT